MCPSPWMTRTVPVNSEANRLDVLANDSTRTRARTLTMTAVTSQAASGTVTVAADGSAVLFTPAKGFAGTVTFKYTISDGNGGRTSRHGDGAGRPGQRHATATASPTASRTGPPLDRPHKADTDDDGLKDGTEDKNHNGSVDSGETDPERPGHGPRWRNDGDEVDGNTNPLD